MLQLTEEGYQLRLAQQQQLSDLIAKLQDQSSSQYANTAEELTECRRHSCGDIQQYLQGGLRALEDRYNHCNCSNKCLFLPFDTCRPSIVPYF